MFLWCELLISTVLDVGTSGLTRYMWVAHIMWNVFLMFSKNRFHSFYGYMFQFLEAAFFLKDIVENKFEIKSEIWEKDQNKKKNEERDRNLKFRNLTRHYPHCGKKIGTSQIWRKSPSRNSRNCSFSFYSGLKMIPVCSSL